SINPSRELTITMWLRVDQIQNNYMPTLVKGGDVAGYFENREYALYTKQNFSLWYPQWKSAGDSSGMHELDSDHHSYTAGRWTFFVFIVDRTTHTMKMY